ncbi:MAG TPA: hypothetical protein VF282_06685 [Bacillota bacterium]
MAGWLRRLPRVAAAAALVFLALVGGSRLYTARAVDAPAETALEALPFVTAAEVESTAQGARRVLVALGPVAHLREAWLEVARASERALGPGPLELEIQDHRDPDLLDAYYRLRPYVLEAAETGRHSAMASAFRAEAAALGLDAASTFTVDAGRIYVQLYRGDAYLYAVEPRGRGDGSAGDEG